MNKELSLRARIHNAAATQEVEFIHATHTFLHARAFSTEEWSRIWAHGNPDKNSFDTASWAHAFGRMRGWRSVWHGSVTLYDVKCAQRFTTLYEAMPEVGGLDIRPLMEVSMHTLATDIVEVADDGLSARATFLTPGNISGAASANLKRRAGGLWERYGADFVYEDDRWLFLHEQVCPDLGVGCDSGNTGHDNYVKLTGGGGMEGFGGPGGPGGAPGGGAPGGPGGAPGGGGPGGPGGAPGGGGPGGPGGGVNTQPDCEDKGPLHSNWSCTQTVQNPVPWPEPYKTLDNENSFTKNK